MRMKVYHRHNVAIGGHRRDIMIQRKVMIKNPLGLHLRPASRLCEEALKFNSKITFTHLHITANAKSVLSVLGAGIKSGNEIVIICDGPDEEHALDTIYTLIESGLGEELN